MGQQEAQMLCVLCEKKKIKTKKVTHAPIPAHPASIVDQARRVMRVSIFSRVENINLPPPKIVGFAGQGDVSDRFCHLYMLFLPKRMRLVHIAFFELAKALVGTCKNTLTLWGPRALI